ncbi:hypothetical protein ACN4EE_17145 [Geminocystis sp. CENA526]|uniref:hypothetical protein n=1 Tax=Geminocystis sp. CENA526 TaxID=1355871 RepID=UPI003D6F0AAE
MSLPILQPSTIDTTQIRGDVTIDRSVMIASGVILNATFGHKIILASGVCLGMGTIITAYDGDIEIRENTILGSGSLIFGSCVVGAQVSLGASVTIYNTDIEPLTVIPAGTIIGDRSRQVELKRDNNSSVSQIKQEESNSSPPLNAHTQTIIDGIKNGFATNLDSINGEKNETQNEDLNTTENQKIEEDIIEKEIEFTSEEKVSENVDNSAEVLNNDITEDNPPQVNTVVGQVYINKLLFTLFPERKNR